MNILVVGGTGFIGVHAVGELLLNGHNVRLACRDIYKSNHLFGDHVKAVSANLDYFQNINFDRLFSDIDTVIYATGADPRQRPSIDDYQYFFQENVNTCIHFLEKARQHGVQHAIVLGSYFTYLDQKFNDLMLRERHPYIKSRFEQKQKALDLSDKGFTVNFMEIPYVFGFTPMAAPRWQKLINYIRLYNPMVGTQGGINIISVQTVAKAIQGAVSCTQASGTLTIGDENVSWQQLFAKISAVINKKERGFHYFNDINGLANLNNHDFFHRLFGFYSGFNKDEIGELLTRDCFIDNSMTRKTLGYQGGDTQKAIEDMIEQYPLPRIINQVQQSVNWTHNFVKGFKSRMKEINK